MSTSPSRGRRLGDVTLTIVLAVVSVIVAIVLVLSAALWGAGETVNGGGVALGILGPIIITLVGLVVAIVQMIRNRLGWIVPLVSIALSVLVCGSRA
jgi:hypothetical protein